MSKPANATEALRVCPREPTNAMLKAMLREIANVGGWINNDSLAAAWRAAYDESLTAQSIPQEPTDAMYRAGMKEIAAAVDADAMPSPFVVWRAMYDAAPVLATAPAEPPKDDSLRMDWLGSGHMDHDLTICSPGNHGGSMLNWLLVVDTWGRGPRDSNREYEGGTLREAIDAAMKDGIK